MTTHSLDEFAIVGIRDLWLPGRAVWIFHLSIATGWEPGIISPDENSSITSMSRSSAYTVKRKNGLTRNHHPAQCNISLRRQGVAFAGISGETKTRTLAEYSYFSAKWRFASARNSRTGRSVSPVNGYRTDLSCGEIRGLRQKLGCRSNHIATMSSKATSFVDPFPTTMRLLCNLLMVSVNVFTVMNLNTKTAS
jgi:hypothetical protein